MTDALRHDHGGKLFQLFEGGETTFAKVTYTRWLCSCCKGITLVPVVPTRAQVLREIAEAFREQTLPTNSELSMAGGAGPFVDKGIEAYMEGQHDAYNFLDGLAKEAEG